MSSAYDFSRPEADSPFALAYRMAGYVKDAGYIARYVAQEHGAHLAPTVKQVEAMQLRHQQRRGQVKEQVAKRDADKKFAFAGERQPVTPAANDDLTEPAQPEPLPLTIALLPHERIIASVASYFGLSATAVRGRGRLARHVTARAVAIRLLREQTYGNGDRRYTYPMIGRMMNRDHTSVLYLSQTFHDRARKFPEMIEAYEALR